MRTLIACARGLHTRTHAIIGNKTKRGVAQSLRHPSSKQQQSAFLFSVRVCVFVDKTTLACSECERVSMLVSTCACARADGMRIVCTAGAAVDDA